MRGGIGRCDSGDDYEDDGRSVCCVLLFLVLVSGLLGPSTLFGAYRWAPSGPLQDVDIGHF